MFVHVEGEQFPPCASENIVYVNLVTAPYKVQTKRWIWCARVCVCLIMRGLETSKRDVLGPSWSVMPSLPQKNWIP